NDLYLLSAHDLSATLVQTSGEIPSPRVGHACAIISSVLIVWGGDTKTDPLSDQSFLNDLWSFDLDTLRTPTAWELCQPVGAPRPTQRTGHACVTYQDRIIVFGGTDGLWYYNDTWSYDTITRTWSELECIGFIPSPREGHAAAVVDDVIYIFGGRGVGSKDLGDLAALGMSNQRWYMFQNMGPAPSGRSGHAMASVGTKVFVLGGESFTPTKPDDHGIINVLDTST
ncbi:hypothetical protein EV702DRAFT_968580, partial [Suillus placidus]